MLPWMDPGRVEEEDSPLRWILACIFIGGDAKSVKQAEHSRDLLLTSSMK